MRRPNELVRAVVWLTERLVLAGRDITRAELWILPGELGVLAQCRGDAIERDQDGTPIRLCGMKLRVLGVLETQAGPARGA